MVFFMKAAHAVGEGLGHCFCKGSMKFSLTRRVDTYGNGDENTAQRKQRFVPDAEKQKRELICSDINVVKNTELALKYWILRLKKNSP
jgi:hypothetical protein